jgi:hypothetical protein
LRASGKGTNAALQTVERLPDAMLLVAGVAVALMELKP